MQTYLIVAAVLANVHALRMLSMPVEWDKESFIYNAGICGMGIWAAVLVGRA